MSHNVLEIEVVGTPNVRPRSRFCSQIRGERGAVFDDCVDTATRYLKSVSLLIKKASARTCMLVSLRLARILDGWQSEETCHRRLH